jgi:hypothetical protein
MQEQKEINAAPIPMQKPRLTIVECVYYQAPFEDCISAENRYDSAVEADEQPYIRKIKVGEQWQPIDSGWIMTPGLLLIKNEPIRFAVQPTQEQRAEAASKVVEVSVCLEEKGRTQHSPPKGLPMTVTTLLPGESLRMRPAEFSTLRLRCTGGEASCLIHLFPR